MVMSSVYSHYYARGFLLGALVGGVVSFAALKYLSNIQLDVEGQAKHKKDQEQRQFQRGLQAALEDEILAEQFTRNVQFFGASGQHEVLNAFVVVIGLGVRSRLQPGNITRLTCISKLDNLMA